MNTKSIAFYFGMLISAPWAGAADFCDVAGEGGSSYKIRYVLEQPAARTPFVEDELLPWLEARFGVKRADLALQETPRFRMIFVQFPAGTNVSLAEVRELEAVPFENVSSVAVSPNAEKRASKE